MSILRALALRMAGHPPQHLVAGRVAVGVVDLLEVVDVGEEQRHREAAPLGAPQHRREALLERPVVDEAGEPVGGRLLLDASYMRPFCSEIATWLAITPSISRRSVGKAPARAAATVKVPTTSSFTRSGSTSSDS